MSRNAHMSSAKRNKDDEYYTRLCDIENELQHYEHHFNGKVVLCNCDGEDSNFIKYFTDNFDRLGLKELLTHSRDFKSIPCVKLLEQADIVVTNPPFSLFRHFIQQVIDYDKKFLVVGNFGSITYKNIFEFLLNEMLWFGYNTSINKFDRPDGSVATANASWFTNMEYSKGVETIQLFKKYNKRDYPKYDNFDAIEVDKVANVPIDYDGVMGVPISYIIKHNPKHFEILGISCHPYLCGGIRIKGMGLGGATINGKEKYARLFIRHKTA